MKRRFKSFLSLTLALTIMGSVLLPAETVLAATTNADPVYAGYIKADNTGLYPTGSYLETPKEYMNEGERIDYFEQRYGVSMDFNFMRRVYNGSTGYVHHDYVRFTP